MIVELALVIGSATGIYAISSLFISRLSSRLSEDIIVEQLQRQEEASRQKNAQQQIRRGPFSYV